MKRTALKRKTPLRRTGGLTRSPMKRVNKERKARRDAEAFGEQAELCRWTPCVVCWRETPKSFMDAVRDCIGLPLNGTLSGQSEPHHIPTRGAGGGDKDTVPLCRTHHQEWHDTGEQTFAAKYGLDLRAVAAALCSEIDEGVE